MSSQATPSFDTLLIVSMGELGTHVLEAVARSRLFERIVVASRSGQKATERVNNALIGAGLEGYFPRFEALAFDFNDTAASARVLRALAPDVVFSSPTLLPWWKVAEPSSGPLPFGAYLSLHLAPMAILRDCMAQAAIDTCWIGASYPDVINASLTRSGYGPTCGVGNVQEPIAKIQAGISRVRGVPARDVKVRLVAQHAFEYYAFRANPDGEMPPYLLSAQLNGEDVTALADQVLREPFPFPYDLHFNRVTTSATIAALEAFAAPEPTSTHLPGVLDLPGGYPVTVDGPIRDLSISLDLAPGWTRDGAVDVNNRSMKWEGISELEADGTVMYDEATAAELKRMTGMPCDTVTPETAAPLARKLLSHFRN